MASPAPGNWDPPRRFPAPPPSKVPTSSDFPSNRENGGSSSSSRMNLDAPPPDLNPRGPQIAAADPPAAPRRTVNDVWREIVSGERMRVCKQEVPDEEMMTLEDFLARAGASVGGEEEDEEVEVKDVKLVQPLPALPPAHQLSGGGGSMFLFEPKTEPGVDVVGGGGSGLRGKRGPPLMEPLDRAAQQRQRRMIKNRESAARSRERKQAYQTELETLAMKLEEENERLLKEKAERTKKRHKQLMERVVPIVEKPKSARVLRRVWSM